MKLVFGFKSYQLADQNDELARRYDARLVARSMSRVFRRDLAALGVQLDANL